MIQREINNKTNEDRSRSASNLRRYLPAQAGPRIIRVKRIIRVAAGSKKTPIILAGFFLVCLLGLSYTYGTRPPRGRALTKSPLLWAKMDGSLTDEVSSGSSFAYSPGKPSTASGISLKEGDNIQYGPGAAIDAGSDVYENWNPNQGTMNVWVQPSWAGNDNEAHWIWSADAGRIDTADANLVAYWKLDEGSEKFALDSSTSDNVGYLHGPALSFDGGDYVNMGNILTSTLQGVHTVEFWMKASAVSAVDVILGKVEGWVNDAVYSINSDLSIAGINGACGASLTLYSATAVTLTDGWHHIMFVFSDTDIQRYIDGNSDGTFSALVNVCSSNNEFSIGARSAGNWTNFFEGVIDEVRIYNRALSATEVGQHYAGTFADESGLVGYWDMDENTGQTVADSSGNSNNGTLGADSGSSTDDPTWVNYAPRWTEEGRFGEALQLDGSDDEIEFGDINF